MRVFLALDLPMAVRSQLVLQQFLLPVKRRQPPENFHITLVFLGEADGASLEELDASLSRLEVNPFSLRIEGLGLFGRDKAHNLHAKVIPAPELLALQEKLERLARSAGFDLQKRRFIPHVTLAYLKPDPLTQPALEVAIAQQSGFRTDPFEVSQISLYRSHLRSDGAEYDLLEHYPFSERGRALKQ